MGGRDKYTTQRELGRGSKIPTGFCENSQKSSTVSKSRGKGTFSSVTYVDWGARKKSHCCIPWRCWAGKGWQLNNAQSPPAIPKAPQNQSAMSDQASAPTAAGDDCSSLSFVKRSTNYFSAQPSATTAARAYHGFEELWWSVSRFYTQIWTVSGGRNDRHHVKDSCTHRCRKVIHGQR